MSCASLKKCLSNPPHLVKLVVMIGCIFVSMQQTMKFYVKLSNPPISTHYRFTLNDSFRYPSVTVCRRPSFKAIHFRKYDVRSTNLKSPHAFQRFNFSKYSIIDFLNETTFSFSELFGSLGYAGCGNSCADIDIDSVQTVDRGRCFILTPRRNSYNFGMSGGWFLYLKHDRSTRVTDDFGQSLYGFRLYLHDKREMLCCSLIALSNALNILFDWFLNQNVKREPEIIKLRIYDNATNELISTSDREENSYVTYIYLESAELMNIHLDIKEVKRCPSSTSPCIKDDPEGYSKSRCLEICFQKQLAAIGNCTLPWLYALEDLNLGLPQCSNYQDVRMLISGFSTYNRTRLLRNCNCEVSCNITMYHAAVVNRRAVEERNHPDSMITMHSSSNLVGLIEEKFGYDFNSFVADIGGSLGFLLGLSVVGCLGLLEKIVLCIIRLRQNMKQKETDIESQPTEVTSVTSRISSDGDRCLFNEKNLYDETSAYHKEFSNANLTDNLYENLKDFNSESFRCYEKSRVGKAQKF